MAFVVRFEYLQHPKQRNTAFTRDTFYTLFTIICLLLLSYVYAKSVKHTGRQPLLVAMEDALRQHIVEKVTSQVNAAMDPPPLRQIFDDLKRDPTGVLPAETAHRLDGLYGEKKTDLLEDYNTYLDELDGQHGHLRYEGHAREF
jgi:hypothetical protein